MKIVVLLMGLALGGCVTDREEGALLARYYERAEVDAITATMACKQTARTLVQIARCEVRR
jgi:hypothetical protein